MFNMQLSKSEPNNNFQTMARSSIHRILPHFPLAVVITIFVLLLPCVTSSDDHVTVRAFHSMYYFGNGDPVASDGLPMSDFLASAFNLPSPSQSIQQKSASIFDVTTAMNTTFLLENGIGIKTDDDRSLEAAFESFDTSLQSSCPHYGERKKKLFNAIFVLDQIGSEDYKHFFLNAKTLEETSQYVPEVVETIKKSIEKLIELGVSNILVSGNLPMGCLPSYLTLFRTDDSTQYNAYHCHRGVNALAELHNSHLRMGVSEMRMKYPDVRIIYGDMYKAFSSLLRHHTMLGFKDHSLLKACCGVGGAYNFDPAVMCGKQGLPTCSDPSKYLNWDGFHLTQEAMKLIVQALMRRKGFLFPQQL